MESAADGPNSLSLHRVVLVENLWKGKANPYQENFSICIKGGRNPISSTYHQIVA